MTAETSTRRPRRQFTEEFKAHAVSRRSARHWQPSEHGALIEVDWVAGLPGVRGKTALDVHLQGEPLDSRVSDTTRTVRREGIASSGPSRPASRLSEGIGMACGTSQPIEGPTPCVRYSQDHQLTLATFECDRIRKLFHECSANGTCPIVGAWPQRTDGRHHRNAR